MIFCISKGVIRVLNNHARLVHFFQVSQHVGGRKKLQKLIYILQKCHVPFKEKFQFHFYGPYSEELTLRVEELCNLNLVTEKKEDKGNYLRYNYDITEDGQAFLEQFSLHMPDFSAHVELLQEKSSRFLELVSTMFFFDEMSKEDVELKVNRVKPKQNYTEQEMEEAWTFIATLQNLRLT